MEDEVIADIARRVKKTGRYTETAELMAKSMAEQGYSAEKIQAEVMRMLRADRAYQMAVAENTKAYKQEIQDIIDKTVQEAKASGDTLIAEAGNMAWNNDLSMWQAQGVDLKKPNNMSQLVLAFQKQTRKQLKNLTRTMGFANTVFGTTGILNAYQREMDLALLKVATGAFSYDQAVNDCIKRLAKSGLRSIDYASGRSYQLDTAARMCVRTGMSQLAGKVMEENLKSTGQDLVITSQHMGSRPEHAVWQNKVFSYSGRNKKYPDFVKSTGYGTVTGLKGANCTHDFYPFWEGASIIPEDVKEPKPVKVNGREYTYYQATQQQRKMERDIRAIKREIEAQKAVGGDIAELEDKLRVRKAEYRRFSNAANLKVKNNRLRVESGTSDLKKTKTIKWVDEQYKGYTASIPKTWGKTQFVEKETLLGTNPKFVAVPHVYDKEEVKYHTNCVNSTIAYEMRCRGYKVIAGKSNAVLRDNPTMAWEDVEAISYNKVAFDEIEKQMKEWGNGSRACVCFKNTAENTGHAIVAENINGRIDFLDVQLGKYYNKEEAEWSKYNHTLLFRIDNAIISNRGVNACEKE